MAKKGRTKQHNGRVKTRAPAQHSSAGFSQVSSIPTRYPLFPRQLQFSTHWTQTVEVDLGGTTYHRRIGLFDFLNQIPEYAIECYQLYRYCRIVAVDLALIVAGESDEANQNYAFEAAMARVPYDQSLGPIPQELRLVRGSRYGLSSTAGQNRITLNGKYGAFDELGNPVLDRQFWQTIIEAQNVTPPEPDRPVVALAVASVNGNKGLVSVNLTATYHVQFFDLMYKRIITFDSDQKKPPAKKDPPKNAFIPSGPRDSSFLDDEEGEMEQDKRHAAKTKQMTKRS